MRWSPIRRRWPLQLVLAARRVRARPPGGRLVMQEGLLAVERGAHVQAWKVFRKPTHLCFVLRRCGPVIGDFRIRATTQAARRFRANRRRSRARCRRARRAQTSLGFPQGSRPLRRLPSPPTARAPALAAFPVRLAGYALLPPAASWRWLGSSPGRKTARGEVVAVMTAVLPATCSPTWQRTCATCLYAFARAGLSVAAMALLERERCFHTVPARYHMPWLPPAPRVARRARQCPRRSRLPPRLDSCRAAAA